MPSPLNCHNFVTKWYWHSRPFRCTLWWKKKHFFLLSRAPKQLNDNRKRILSSIRWYFATEKLILVHKHWANPGYGTHFSAGATQDTQAKQIVQRTRSMREHNQYSHSFPFPLVNSHFHSNVLIFLFQFPFKFCYIIRFSPEPLPKKGIKNCSVPD